MVGIWHVLSTYQTAGALCVLVVAGGAIHLRTVYQL